MYDKSIKRYSKATIKSKGIKQIDVHISSLTKDCILIIALLTLESQKGLHIAHVDVTSLNV